jgi:glycosyltransferase involved in cell wall biosynthesis
VKIGINAMVLGPQDAGVGVWTRGLICALARADAENQYVVYHRRAAGLPAAGAGENFRFVPVDLAGPSRAARIAWEQFVLPGRAHRDGVDVLHCPAYVMPRRATVPTVVTLHDLFVYTHPRFCRWLNLIHYRMMLPQTLRHATLVHCTSHWTRGVFGVLFQELLGKARVIQPGVDDIFVPPAAAAVERFRREHGLAEPPFLFVGSVEPKKNLRCLLDAFTLVQRLHGSPRKLLLVGGSGWKSVGLDRMIRRLGIADSVVRLGYVPREELPVIYGSSLALVFPSAIEGFGLPPLEAMACGTPVVSSDRGGLAESVGAAALVVKHDDPASIADAMHKLEESAELCRKHATAGIRRAAVFRWDRAARQFVDLYGEAVRLAGERAATPGQR